MRWALIKIPFAALIFAASLAGQTRQPCIVTRVMDDGTVELASGEIVRLIGVQNFPNNLGSQSLTTSFLGSQILNKTIACEYDDERPAKPSGRWGYLWQDSLMINIELLRRGFVCVWDDTTEFRYQEMFLVAEHEARARRRGNWKSASFFSAVIDTPTTTDDDTVYVTESGKKYHRADCRLLSQNHLALPLSKARFDFTACRLCMVTISAADLSLQQNGKSKVIAAKCLAKTKSGKRCTREAEPGSKYCWQHRQK